MPDVPALSRTIVLDEALAAPTTVTRVQARRITMPPEVAAGLHVHNGPVVGSIVEGSVTFQVDGEAERTLEPGDTFVENRGERIARFDAGPEGVVFLAWFLLPDGVEPAMHHP